jgi:hypothetical protein
MTVSPTILLLLCPLFKFRTFIVHSFELLQRRPGMLAVLAAAVAGPLGDAFVQQLELRWLLPSVRGHQATYPNNNAAAANGSARTLDLARLALTWAYCTCAAHWVWYPACVWMDLHVGRGARPVVVFQKTCVVAGLLVPFVDLPAFYLATLSPRIGWRAAVARLRADYLTVVGPGVALWGLLSFCAFKLAPEHVRTLVLLGCSGFWVALLSYVSNSRGLAKWQSRVALSSLSSERKAASSRLSV